MVYPQWSYFPRNSKPPEWVDGVLKVVSEVESTICTIHTKTGLNSDAVLRELRPGLEAVGFKIETGKKRDEKITRPVLYGENGVPEVRYDIDGFNEDLGIALEVEAGQGRANNNDYRDIVRSSLILDVRFLILVMPIHYRSGPKQTITKDYRDCRDQIAAIYTSPRLRLPFEGLLLVGY